jgi:hypothetical protein
MRQYRINGKFASQAQYADFLVRDNARRTLAAWDRAVANFRLNGTSDRLSDIDILRLMDANIASPWLIARQFSGVKVMGVTLTEQLYNDLNKVLCAGKLDKPYRLHGKFVSEGIIKSHLKMILSAWDNATADFHSGEVCRDYDEEVLANAGMGTPASISFDVPQWCDCDKCIARDAFRWVPTYSMDEYIS